MNPPPETLTGRLRLQRHHPLRLIRIWIAGRFLCYLLIIFQVLFFAGCAHLMPIPEDQADARQLVDRLNHNSDNISQFKGLAQIRLVSNGRVVSGRIAIAAVAPDKMRVEWMNPMGQPVSSLIADGKTIALLSRIDNTHRRLRQSATGLEPLIHMPVGIGDLFDILTGSVPLPVDTFVQIKQALSEPDTLIVKNRWNRTVADIRVDRTACRPQSMRFYNGQDELQYQIRWLQWRQDGKGHDLPIRIEFQSDDSQQLNLTMERFWPNAPVPLSLFATNSSAE